MILSQEEGREICVYEYVYEYVYECGGMGEYERTVCS